MHTERKKGGDSCCDMFSNATVFKEIKIDIEHCSVYYKRFICTYHYLFFIHVLS